MSATVASMPTSAFTPALEPPPGVVSNPEHPESLAHRSHITVAVRLPLVTLFFGLRRYVRIFNKKTWTFEDWLCFTSWGGTTAFCGTLLATMNNHGGQHLWDLTKEQWWFWIACIEYGVMICVAKISVLWLYRRVLSGRKNSLFDIEVMILIAVLLAFYIAITLAKIFSCMPRAKITNAAVPGTCIDVSHLLNTSGFFNTITDFCILLMPAQARWRLKMEFKRKVWIMLVFTFGLCAPVFSPVSLAVRLRISDNPDTSWNQPEILLWSAAELTAGNICVCFSELDILFRSKTYSGSDGPTASVREVAKTISDRSRRTSDKGTGLTVVSCYAGFGGEAEKSRRHRSEITGSSATSTERILPSNSVVVDYEFDVESSSSSSSLRHSHGRAVKHDNKDIAD